MAFLRFTRDRRGYEHFYLVEPSSSQGKSSPRLLYWFRTPPNVKVGREPFSDGVRAELESNNSDVSFDWRKILETPIPSADAEKWRERRRAQKAERAGREAAPAERDAFDDSSGSDEDSGERPVHVVEAAAAAARSDSAVIQEETAGAPINDPGAERKKRRRRRGRRADPNRGTPGNEGSDPPPGDV